LGAGRSGEIEDYARNEAWPRESGELGARHSAPDDGHEPGGKLVIGDALVSDTLDENSISGGEFRGVAFFADESTARMDWAPSKLASAMAESTKGAKGS